MNDERPLRVTDPSLHAPRSTLYSFLAMVRVQAILISRYPVNLAAGLLVSFGGVLALALATRMFTPATSGSTGEIAGVMFYGYLLYAFLSDSLWRIGYSVRQDQVQGTLEGLYLTPAPKFASLVSRAVPLFALTGAGAALALAAANWIFGGLPAANLGLATVVFLCSVVGTFGLGFCFAAYTLVAGEAASSTANFLEFALLVVCAMFFPFRVLPGPVQWISRIVPLSYCVDAFRSTLIGLPPGFPELAPIGTELVVVAMYAVTAPILGYALFRAVERRLRQNGRLGQY